MKDLAIFIKDECACFVKHCENCLDGKTCKVLSGSRCGYFEKAVLGSADFNYRLPGYDYQKLFAQYAEQTKTKTQVVSQRLCSCGKPLQLRQRFCSGCSKQRRKNSNRAYNKNRRKLCRLNYDS
jgi:hypothetical protein